MRKSFLLVVIILLTTSCTPQLGNLEDKEKEKQSPIEEPYSEHEANASHNPIIVDLFNEDGTTIEDRIETPEGFERVEVEENSFGQYLRTLPLKPHGSKVEYYDGRIKRNDVHVAVIDMDVGDRDLQQCADAIMRLRAEYLFEQKEYGKIHFNFTNGFRVDYLKWAEGNRVSVNGNNVCWVKRADYSNTYETFRKYLNIIYSYAGTLSLSKELQPINVKDMSIGDVIIQGGSPGHAVIVVDMAENRDTGEKLFLIAQSYMPAQSIHVLKNPENEMLSPWFSLNFDGKLYTPEWVFTKDDFKRFD